MLPDGTGRAPGNTAPVCPLPSPPVLARRAPRPPVPSGHQHPETLVGSQARPPDHVSALPVQSAAACVPGPHATRRRPGVAIARRHGLEVVRIEVDQAKWGDRKLPVADLQLLRKLMLEPRGHSARLVSGSWGPRARSSPCECVCRAATGRWGHLRPPRGCGAHSGNAVSSQRRPGGPLVDPMLKRSSLVAHAEGDAPKCIPVVPGPRRRPGITKRMSSRPSSPGVRRFQEI